MQKALGIAIGGFLLFAPAWGQNPRTVHSSRPVLVSAVRLRFTSSASPAVGDVNGDGKADIAVTSDNIGDKTRSLSDPYNVNSVQVFTWQEGRLRSLPGWPQATRDATLGISMADLDKDSQDEVVASCAQDLAPADMEKAGLWLVSRLYVWRGDGTAMAPWFPSPRSEMTGLSVGHCYAAPVVHDINADGQLDILQSSQGMWRGRAFENGGLKWWSGSGFLLAESQSKTARVPWRTYATFAPDTPPILANLAGDESPEIVSASFDGRLYAWDRHGAPVPGWAPSTGALPGSSMRRPIRGTIASVDLDGSGYDDVVMGGPDGTLYAWKEDGTPLWRRTMDTSELSSGLSITSVSIGRVGPLDSPEYSIVTGDTGGGVTAWRTDGSVRWRQTITSGFSVEAEPAIGDVNADGVNDVVVGGTDGFVYAWDGATGRLHWQVPTWWAPTPQGMRLEAVFGAPALVDLRGDGHLSVVVATAQRYADVPTRKWYGYGHLLAYDCGPDTFDVSRLDWPQYRGNARRTGRAAPLLGNAEKTRTPE